MGTPAAARSARRRRSMRSRRAGWKQPQRTHGRRSPVVAAVRTARSTAANASLSSGVSGLSGRSVELGLSCQEVRDSLSRAASEDPHAAVPRVDHPGDGGTLQARHVKLCRRIAVFVHGGPGPACHVALVCRRIAGSVTLTARPTAQTGTRRAEGNLRQRVSACRWRRRGRTRRCPRSRSLMDGLEASGPMPGG